tara:strand:- start:1618 stop:2289 length:672 start_codon:yes stop_codon:yes gene_type:complete
MHLRINKKILFYLFLFILLGTLNNPNNLIFELPKIHKIEVQGLSGKKKLELLEKLNYIKINNIFFLDQKKIKGILNSLDNVENYTIKKKYPSSLIIEITEAEPLAFIKKNGKIYLLGSNEKLQESKKNKLDIPFIFGNFELYEFFELKKEIEKSKFIYNDIKNFYFFKSGRWDLETLSGKLIRLPNKKIKDALDLSSQILKNKDFKNVKTIDLRQKKKLIINE